MVNFASILVPTVLRVVIRSAQKLSVEKQKEYEGQPQQYKTADVLLLFETPNPITDQLRVDFDLPADYFHKTNPKQLCYENVGGALYQYNGQSYVRMLFLRQYNRRFTGGQGQHIPVADIDPLKWPHGKPRYDKPIYFFVRLDNIIKAEVAE